MKAWGGLSASSGSVQAFRMVPPPTGPRYERLEAWQAAHRLTLLVYTLTRTLPDDERYGLVAQMRRAAVSVSSNLVEGSMRAGCREYRRFVGMALGSLFELRYQLHLCRDLSYLSGAQIEQVMEGVEVTSRLVWGLYRSLGGVRDRRPSHPSDPSNA